MNPKLKKKTFSSQHARAIRTGTRQRTGQLRGRDTFVETQMQTGSAVERQHNPAEILELKLRALAIKEASQDRNKQPHTTERRKSSHETEAKNKYAPDRPRYRQVRLQAFAESFADVSFM